MMTYSSLMVHLDLSASNTALLATTAALATRFGARVIGIAASQPLMMAYSDGYMSADVIEEDRAVLEKQCLAAEDEFRAALSGKVAKLSWRSSISYDPLSDVIATEMRAADLLLIAPGLGTGRADASRRVNLGDLVMQLGRPVLVVPPSADALDLNQVVVGWKDTRETRRAVWDALPLLRKAAHVTVAQVSEDDDLTDVNLELQDVTDWLRSHGVTADKLAITSTDHASARLEALAADRGAQILVTGAYGHNRVREWVLGGVTRDLLQHPTRCSFVSH
jgi:nucleotide-binding universal stress UspA family protein